MRVSVQPLFSQGLVLKKNMRQEFRGMLRIREERSNLLGRTVVLAEVISATDGPIELLLPPLADAQVKWLHDGTMRICGTENIEGAHCYQTWEARLMQ